MQTFKVPRSSSDLPQQVQRLRTDADSILRKFGTQKILEKKLSTKTFNYEFDLSGARSGGQRKSIQKLRDIIIKSVKKQIPYLDYTRDGDILQNSTASNAVMIKLTSHWMTVTQTPTGLVEEVGYALPYVKSLKRYLTFLRYKCIRNGIPIDVPMRLVFETHPDDIERHTLWNNKRKTTGLSFRIRVKATISPKLYMHEYPGYVQLTQSMLDSPNNEMAWIDSYEKFEEYLTGLNSPELLRAYHNPRNWNGADITGRRSVLFITGSEKYTSPEKVFLVLDEIQQVIKTLSRKTSYDTAAFNIGSSEASGSVTRSSVSSDTIQGS